MKKRILTTMTLLALSAGASAETGLADYLLVSCEDDLTEFCSDVTPGEGRLLNCMAAYSDKLSGQCQDAVINAANLLIDLSDRVQDLAMACETELEENCADVPIGEGRILACLKMNTASLGDDCKAALANIVDDPET